MTDERALPANAANEVSQQTVSPIVSILNAYAYIP